MQAGDKRAFGAKGGHKGGQRGGREAGLFGLPGLGGVNLNLTDEQKAQMKAIAEKYRPEKPAAGQKGDFAAKREELKAKQEALKALLVAPEVDAAALKTALEAAKPARPAQADQGAQRVAMLAELRGVLTDAQRADLAAALQKPVTQPSAPAPEARQKPGAEMKGQLREKIVSDLALTADQQAKLDALTAKLQAGRGGATGPRFEGLRAAFAQFIQDGDTAALQSALEAAKPTPPERPLDEIVAFVASLDQGQRQKLVSGFGAMLGGPGGFGGGRDGFGPRGGPEGGFGPMGGPDGAKGAFGRPGPRGQAH